MNVGIILNQLGRRNLSEVARHELRGRYVREAPKEPGKRTDTSLQNATRLQTLQDREGVGRTTLHQDKHLASAMDVIAEHAGEEFRQVSAFAGMPVSG